MLSSARTLENFAVRLRQAAQLRFTGALEAVYPGFTTTVVVRDGRLVDVIDSRIGLPQEVVRRLSAAGRLPAGIVSNARSLDQLFGELAAMEELSNPIDPVFFKRVVRETIYERLFQIDLTRAGDIGFYAWHDDISARFAPAIDIIDFLDEVVAGAADAHRFRAVVRAGARVEGTRKSLHSLTSVERAIMACLAESVPVDELYHGALLSRRHFESALLGLIDRGFVVITGRTDEQEAKPAPVGSSEIAHALTGIIEATERTERFTLGLATDALVDSAEGALVARASSPSGVLGRFRNVLPRILWGIVAAASTLTAVVWMNVLAAL